MTPKYSPNEQPIIMYKQKMMQKNNILFQCDNGLDIKPSLFIALFTALFIMAFLIALPLSFAQDAVQTQDVVQTQEGAQQDKAEPIEIEADDTLEWDRDAQTYTANGNATATQGDASIRAATLVADYKENDQGKNEIWRLTAAQDVVLTSPEGQVFGDQAVYMINDGLATMTGDDLRLIMPDQTVTARDSFEYFTNDQRFVANGDVKVVREDDTLTADKMSTFFTDDSNGERVLDKMEAQGRVTITTPDEVITGRVGSYDPQTDMAEIIGNVKITRGPNILTGTRATVNLRTNISRVYGAPKAGQRVKGVFFPEN